MCIQIDAVINAWSNLKYQSKKISQTVHDINLKYDGINFCKACSWMLTITYFVAINQLKKTSLFQTHLSQKGQEELSSWLSKPEFSLFVHSKTKLGNITPLGINLYLRVLLVDRGKYHKL